MTGHPDEAVKKSLEDLAAGQGRRKELLHIAQAGGPLNQRPHRRAVTLDLGIDGDHVAGVEAEGLYHIKAVGGVVEGESAGSQTRPVAGAACLKTVT